jgi:hypothetical protein
MVPCLVALNAGNRQDMISHQSCSDNVIQRRSYTRTPLMDMYTCLVQRVSTWSSRSDIPTWGLPDKCVAESRHDLLIVWRSSCNLPNARFGGAVTTRCDGNCRRLRKSGHGSFVLAVLLDRVQASAIAADFCGDPVVLCDFQLFLRRPWIGSLDGVLCRLRR